MDNLEPGNRDVNRVISGVQIKPCWRRFADSSAVDRDLGAFGLGFDAYYALSRFLAAPKNSPERADHLYLIGAPQRAQSGREIECLSDPQVRGSGFVQITLLFENDVVSAALVHGDLRGSASSGVLSIHPHGCVCRISIQ